MGLGTPAIELPVATIQIKELRVTGTFRYANVYPGAIALAASGAVDLDSLVTGRFGWARTRGPSATKADPNTLKPMVYPGVTPHLAIACAGGCRLASSRVCRLKTAKVCSDPPYDTR